MRRSLVVGNWKMHGTRAGVRAFLTHLGSCMGNSSSTEIGVCFPFVFLADAADCLHGTPVLLGAQNVADHESGPYTGEISAAMLAEFGCRLVIVGHSERRILYRETDDLVARRFRQALAKDLCPVLCVGETLEQRDAGTTFDIIDKQLAPVLNSVAAKEFAKGVIAYEPVWAIGTGVNATPDQGQEVHAFIRQRVAELDREASEAVRILYGGSVNPGNADALFSMADIDGGLVGGASLQSESFFSIFNSANLKP